MPAYNAERTIRRSVASVLSQSLRDIELIVLDDGSTDATLEVLATLRDSRLRIIEHERNAGLVAMLNEGIDVVRAPVIARLDADDEATPDRLERQYRALVSEPNVGLVVSAYHRMDDGGAPLARARWQTPSPHHAGAWLGLLFRNGICHSTAMFDSALIRSLGGYDPACYPAEDYDLWLRLVEHARYIGLPDRLVRYRVSEAGITEQQPKQMEKAALARSARAIEDITGTAPDLEVLRGLTFASQGLPAHLFDQGLELLVRCRDAVADTVRRRGISTRGIASAMAPLLLRCGLRDSNGRRVPRNLATLARQHPLLTCRAVGVATIGKTRSLLR